MSSITPAPFQPGFALQDGSQINAAIANDAVSSADQLVALGTTVANALQLSQGFNRIIASAAGTGLILPTAQQSTPGGVVGRSIVVVNTSGQALKVYASDGSTIDGTAGATGVTLSNNNRATFFCIAAGVWVSALLGAVSS